MIVGTVTGAYVLARSWSLWYGFAWYPDLFCWSKGVKAQNKDDMVSLVFCGRLVPAVDALDDPEGFQRWLSGIPTN